MTPKTASDFAWNRTFTGQTYDPRTGMMHYRRRDYDPAIGRFTNRDPIEYEAEDVNLYRYVGNKSPNATDAQGKMLDSISGAIRGCMQLPTYAQRLTCLENLLGSLAESCLDPSKVKKAIDALKNTPVRNLIRGKSKKAKGYASELENMTYEQIEQLAQGKGPMAEKAKTMKKLVDATERLGEKTGEKPR
jgi:RHS repeat-associated protein